MLTLKLAFMFMFIHRIRLISLAAQKFVSDIANDALQHCKMRGTASGSSRSKTKVCSVCVSKTHIRKRLLGVIVLGHLYEPALID